MTCPICGGFIRINEGRDYGECDTCMTYYFEGKIFPDPEYAEEYAEECGNTNKES